MKSPHWDEIDLSKEPVQCEDGIYYHLTERAWDERFAYAKEKTAQIMAELGVHLKELKSRTPMSYEEELEHWKDVMMVHIETGIMEPLVTPKDFSQKHNISLSYLKAFLKDKNRNMVAGWTSTDRL